MKKLKEGKKKYSRQKKQYTKNSGARRNMTDKKKRKYNYLI